MGAGGEDLRHQSGGVGACLLSPAYQALGCPLGIVLMRLGHMGGDGGMAPHLRVTAMTGDPLTPMKHLQGMGAEPHLHFLPD